MPVNHKVVDFLKKRTHLHGKMLEEHASLCYYRTINPYQTMLSYDKIIRETVFFVIKGNVLFPIQDEDGYRTYIPFSEGSFFPLNTELCSSKHIDFSRGHALNIVEMIEMPRWMFNDLKKDSARFVTYLNKCKDVFMHVNLEHNRMSISHSMDKKLMNNLILCLSFYGEHSKIDGQYHKMIYMSQEKLAGIVGTTLQTTNRFISNLKRQGLVKTRNGQIHMELDYFQKTKDNLSIRNINEVSEYG